MEDFRQLIGAVAVRSARFVLTLSSGLPAAALIFARSGLDVLEERVAQKGPLENYKITPHTIDKIYE